MRLARRLLNPVPAGTGKSIAERCPAGSRGFQAPDDTRHGIVAERRLRRMRLGVVEGRRRSARRVTCGNEPGA